jgi:DNA-binding response OmpR family regulator
MIESSATVSEAPHVLVIDDDPLILTILEHKLRARGCRVVAAADGASGLAQARSGPPDLIVLDMMMPIMDGWQVLQELRMDPRFATVPVVMLTARRGDSDVAGALDLGAADYVSKPFSPDELVARVTRLLSGLRVAR